MNHAPWCMLNMLWVLVSLCSVLVTCEQQDESEASVETTTIDNYQWIMKHIWQWPTYPSNWTGPTTVYEVPVYENPSTPWRILKVIKHNDEEMDALEAKLEDYKVYCAENRQDIEFLNRTRWELHEAPQYFACLEGVRGRIKIEKAKFRNGTYLLREIKGLKKKVRSCLRKIVKFRKKFSHLIPEFTFGTRRAEYYQLIEFELAAKRVRREHKLRFQLLTKYLKYYLKHYKPTSTRGTIVYEHLPPGLQKMVDAGQFNITGAIRRLYVTRKIKRTTNLEDIFHNITTKKWKRLTGPELEADMVNWNRYTPQIYFRRFKTTTPWSITVAVKRELNRRKYERMMANLQKRIQAGETTRKMKRWMQAFRRNRPVRKSDRPPTTKKGETPAKTKEISDFEQY